MRSRRIYGSRECCVYHCVTRTVNGEMLFDVKEKEVLRKMLHQIVEFSGVELLTYAIMSNHFHVLVRVSDRAKDVSDAELIQRFKVLYPKPSRHRPEDAGMLETVLKAGRAEADHLRRQLKARMGDVSEFMRTLKQRYSIWFNKSHNRYGPLWSDRFKSCVVENDPIVVRTVAAYIDLNPVRAGLVKDPKDYRFCGYAEAVAWEVHAHPGVRVITGIEDIAYALEDYRMTLFGKGARPKIDGSGVKMTEEMAQSVAESRGSLPTHVLLRQRLRFISNGAVIGSQVFVSQCIAQWSGKIGDKRPRRPKSHLENAPATLTTFRANRMSLCAEF